MILAAGPVQETGLHSTFDTLLDKPEGEYLLIRCFGHQPFRTELAGGVRAAVEIVRSDVFDSVVCNFQLCRAPPRAYRLAV